MSNAKRQKTLSRLLADFARLEDGQNVDVSGVTMDSRTLQAGDLFFACRSVNGREHGSCYAGAAFEKGASAVLVDVDAQQDLSAELIELGKEFSRPVVAIESLDQLAGVIAARFYDQPSEAMKMVGVTGTNGKTSVSQYISQCLSAAKCSCGIIGTLGTGLWGELQMTGFTTPLAVQVQQTLAQLREQGAQAVAMEVSSHGLEQGRVSGVDFNVAVLTNLSRDHLDYHGDMENYAQAKARLFKIASLNSAIVNLDDDFGRSLVKQIALGVNVVGYSLEVENSELVNDLVSGRIERLDRSGMVVNVTSPWGQGQFRSHLLGRFNAQNLLAVLATLLVLDVPFEQALKLVGEVKAPAGRMEVFGGESQPIVVVDYAHTPDALRNVLATMRDHCLGRLWVVFGCGGDRDKGKRPEMAEIAEALADGVVITDDNPRSENAQSIVNDILNGIKERSVVVVEHDREKAIRYAVTQATNNDMVLVAGKGHEDYQLVGDQRLHFSDREVVQDILGVAA